MVQFHLLGDPSVHAVGSTPHSFSRGKAFRQAFQERQNVKGTRSLRRERAARTGTNLGRGLGKLQGSDAPVPPEVAKILEAAAAESGIGAFDFRSFDVTYRAAASARAMKRFVPVREGRQLYMIVGKKGAAREAPGRVVAIVVTVQNGELIHMRRLHSR